MKNIHILPTDKPSRLYFYKGDDAYPPQYGLRSLKSLPFKDSFTNQNIYITNDEEIISNCWIINIVNGLIYKTYHRSHFKDDEHQQWRKIILTTDQDLIKDGVQAIDKDGVQAIHDDFLEWFVKNPSCERVEVTEYLDSGFSYGYKIIIPKEEAKKKHIVMLVGDKVNEEQTKCYCGHTTYCDCGPEELEILEVPMPVENKGILNWNKSNVIPEFDGEYLCYIRCREECGNIHSYYKVVSNSFNIWLINENERVALWKELPKNPFND